MPKIKNIGFIYKKKSKVGFIHSVGFKHFALLWNIILSVILLKLLLQCNNVIPVSNRYVNHVVIPVYFPVKIV